MNAIYLDHCATTPLEPEVMGAMMKYFGNVYGNPSSGHAAGRKAGEAVDAARRQVAALLGAASGEIVFTGGGTESDNLAILGIAAAAPSGKDHIVTLRRRASRRRKRLSSSGDKGNLCYIRSR